MVTGGDDRFRGVIDRMSEGFVLIDRDFVVLEMNREGERIEGRPSSRIVGKSLWKSWPDLEDSELGTLWRQAIADQVAVELDHVYLAPDGRRLCLEMRAYPSEGGLAIFYRDVTDRRDAQAALLETKRRLDAVLDNASVAIFLMDEKQHCSYMNSAAEALTGFTLADMQGRPLHDVIHHKRPDGSPYPIADCPIDQAFPENDHQRGEDVFVHKDGHFYPVAYTASPVRDESSRTVGTIVEVRDISAERHAALELQQTQSELVHLSRVNAMGTMAATIAHELNQPLTAIGNYIRGSRRILMSGGEIAPVLEALEYAESGTQQAGEIVRRVRAFVSTGSVTLAPQDLPALIEQACVLALVDQQVRGVSHACHFHPAARWVAADAIQVQQVIINLVRNAVEAMAACQQRHLEMRTAPVAGNMVEIAIADTGSGIAEDLRETLFSPFHSSKAEGVGVGLSICRTIVEAHHGTIRAEPRAGGGTVFCFTLPAAEADQRTVGQATAR